MAKLHGGFDPECNCECCLGKLRARVAELEAQVSDWDRLSVVHSEMMAAAESAALEEVARRDERWAELRRRVEKEKTALADLAAMLNGSTGDQRDVGLMHAGGAQTLDSIVLRIMDELEGE